MNVWSRRVIVFALVLAAGLVLANTARRITANASARPAVVRPAQTPPVPRIDEPIRQHADMTVTAPASIPDPVRLAATPPTMAPPRPAAARPSRATMTASAAAPAASITKVPASVHTFHDKSYKISFDYPANWTFTQKDHEISTFRLDARTADRRTSLRAVTALPENPYPASTFTGAYVYLSVTPHSSEAKCASQAEVPGAGKHSLSEIGGMSFVHGHDEQKHICTVERDEIYTTYRKGACYRFDLAMNNFCGGEVSGVKDVTQEELDTVRARLESIVGTVRFDPK